MFNQRRIGPSQGQMFRPRPMQRTPMNNASSLNTSVNPNMGMPVPNRMNSLNSMLSSGNGILPGSPNGSMPGENPHQKLRRPNIPGMMQSLNGVFNG